MQTHNWKLVVRYTVADSIDSFDGMMNNCYEDHVRDHVYEIGKKGIIRDRFFIPPHRIHEINFEPVD